MGNRGPECGTAQEASERNRYELLQKHARAISRLTVVVPRRQNTMPDDRNAAPDNTAVRVALSRALHVQVDLPPHVLEDEIGLKLVAPDEGWRNRPDMDPRGTALFRASIVARARFIVDLVVEQAIRGVPQYVLLGAGLDTFAQRRPEFASQLKVFEGDQPGAQAWKQRRLRELGFGIPEWLRFVPIDFEAGGSWRKNLKNAGFDSAKPAIARTSPRGRFQGSPAHLGSQVNRALLCGKIGQPPARKIGGAAARDYLIALVGRHASVHHRFSCGYNFLFIRQHETLHRLAVRHRGIHRRYEFYRRLQILESVLSHFGRDNRCRGRMARRLVHAHQPPGFLHGLHDR